MAQSTRSLSKYAEAPETKRYLRPTLARILAVAVKWFFSWASRSTSLDQLDTFGLASSNAL